MAPEIISSESRSRYWFRVLRPLVWWFLLVIVLFGIRTHQRLREQTRIAFSVLLDGRKNEYEATARLNGVPIFSGTQLPIGTHTFTVSHPKGITFSTNFSVMYGKHDFGNINLARAGGTLNITANPPAAVLNIVGPEFSLTLSNSSGTNLSVPTDRYSVEAKYARWQNTMDVLIYAGISGSANFTPNSVC